MEERGYTRAGGDLKDLDIKDGFVDGAFPWGPEAQLCRPWLDHSLIIGSLRLSQVHS